MPRLAGLAVEEASLELYLPGREVERSRRFHLLLDAYGCEGDREVFGSVVPQRARRQAGVIRRMAAAGDPACVALLPIAGLLESSAVDAEALPRDFWLR